eukprot:2487822-Rhodomonas_salina.1
MWGLFLLLSGVGVVVTVEIGGGRHNSCLPRYRVSRYRGYRNLVAVVYVAVLPLPKYPISIE